MKCQGPQVNKDKVHSGHRFESDTFRMEAISEQRHFGSGSRQIEALTRNSGRFGEKADRDPDINHKPRRSKVIVRRVQHPYLFQDFGVFHNRIQYRCHFED